MHHIVYKITNLLNNKYYIGKHSTNNINDNYMGSNEQLSIDMDRFGAQNFVREVLFEGSTAEEALEMEARLITSNDILSDRCYNKAPGGFGGWGRTSAQNYSREQDEQEFKRSIFNKNLGKRDNDFGDW